MTSRHVHPVAYLLRFQGPRCLPLFVSRSSLRSRKAKGSFPGRGHCSTGDPTAGVLPHGRERDLPGFQAIRPVPLPRSTTPAEPTIPRLFDGFVDAAPTLPTVRASAVNEFRGSIARLRHLLLTLQEWCCHHPCKARFRLAGSPYREGVEPSGLLQKVSDHIPILLFWICPGAREVSSDFPDNVGQSILTPSASTTGVQKTISA